MHYALDLIETGDACSLLGLIIVLCGVGQYVACDPWAQAWGQRLAVGGFVLYCLYGVSSSGSPDAEQLFGVPSEDSSLLR